MTTSSLAEMRAPTETRLPAIQAGFFDLQGFELLQRVAKMFASSSLVPKQYQNNVANCSIALNLARRLGADELMVMQNLYIVHGTPGWSAKFLIACINSCGRFESLRYEWRGNEGEAGYGCRAWTIEKSTGEKLFGTWVDWTMVRAEKWDRKEGSKWLTMPEQMFRYRAGAFWQRAYAPEIGMGLLTAEELADVVDVKADGSYTVGIESLRTDMRRVDEDGEIHDAPTGAPALEDNASPVLFDATAFGAKLRSAKDKATLDALGQELQSIADDGVRSQLEEIFLECVEALPAAAPTPAPTASRRTAARPSTSAE